MLASDTADRRPTWQILTIFDPDGTGGDFAYTVGLHDHGRPELWLAARPSLGDDPGADWMFSMRDACWLLNELARDWIDGRRSVGDEFDRTYDAGFTRARFRIDPPDDRDVLEALRIAPDAEVVPVRWSLHRAIEHEPRPIPEETRAAAEREIDELRSFVPDDHPMPPGWPSGSEPDPDDWSTAARYGPLTPLVTATAALAWTVEDDDVDALHSVLAGLSEEGMHGWPLAVVEAAARASGRSAALACLDDDLAPVAANLADRVLAVAGSSYPGHSREEVREGLLGVIGPFLRTAVGAAVVADVLPEAERLAAVGPLRAAWVVGGVPGADWLARPEVRATVDALLCDAGEDVARAICRIHPSVEDDAYDDVCGRLRARLWTTACGWFLSGEELGPAPERGCDVAELREYVGQRITLQDWGSLLAAAITHRMMLTSEEIAAFARPYQDVVPGLLDVLNTPVCADDRA